MTGPVDAVAIDSLFLQASLYECNILGAQIYRTHIYLFIIEVFLHVCVTVEFLCSVHCYVLGGRVSNELGEVVCTHRNNPALLGGTQKCFTDFLFLSYSSLPIIILVSLCSNIPN